MEFSQVTSHLTTHSHQPIMNKFDLSGARAALATQAPTTSTRHQDMPIVDMSPIFAAAKENGFFVVSVLGSRPKGTEFTPRQPYTWTSESILDFEAALQPQILGLLETHGKVAVFGRTDGFDAGFAAMRVVETLALSLRANSDDNVAILGQPIECFKTRPNWRTPEWQQQRDAILEQRTESGAFVGAFDCLPEYNGPLDYRAVEWALAQHADLVLAIHGPAFHPEWETRLEAQCRAQRTRISECRIQLHRMLPSQATATTNTAQSVARNAVTFASYDTARPITHPAVTQQEDRFTAQPYDGADDRDSQDMTQEQQNALKEADLLLATANALTTPSADSRACDSCGTAIDDKTVTEIPNTETGEVTILCPKCYDLL